MPLNEIMNVLAFLIGMLGSFLGVLGWVHNDLKTRMDEKYKELAESVRALVSSMESICKNISELTIMLAGNQKELEDIEKALGLSTRPSRSVSERIKERLKDTQ